MSSRLPARIASLLALSIAPCVAARAQEIVWESRGEAIHDYLGTSVDRFGDLDGDGLPEIFAGAPDDYDQTATIPGRAFIFGSATGSVLLQWSGTVIGDLFGQAVADAGDVDGDGVDDAIISVSWDTASSSRAGAVYVYSGATGALIHQWSGATATAGFGWAVAGPGDLDGDGRPDVVISNSNPQSLFAYSGASGALLWQFSAGATSGSFGRAMDSVGDVDGDGTPDLIVGAPYDHSSGTNHGAAYLISGRTGSRIRKLLDPTSENTFGFAVSAAGDVDGDGTPDVLVGNPDYSSPVYGARCGAFSVLSGATGATLLKKIATVPNVELGSTVSACGDLDGDGFPDVAGGEGVAGASVFLYSGKSGALLQALAPAYLPYCLRLASDLDGDGAPDFVAGSRFAPYAGAAFTFSSASGNTIQLNLGEGIYERRGNAVAVLADIDGDSWRDVLVGSPDLEFGLSGAPGVARILSGRDGSELRRHDGAVIGDNYGERIVAIPDFTGDGLPDYAIAATGAPIGATGVEVRSGADGALIYSLPNHGFGTSDLRANGLAAGKGPNGRVVLAVAGTGGSGFIELYDLATGGLLLSTAGDAGLHAWGTCVSFVGDVDGDGEGDWIGGAPDFFGPGAAILFSGATGTKLQRFDGMSQDGLGESVSGIGDLDGDGVKDFLLGAPQAAANLGEVSAWSGATGSSLFKVSGFSVSKRFGERVALLGDVNRDGVDDFAVSSEEGLGRAYVFSGRTQGLLAWFGESASHIHGLQIATAASGVPVTVDPDPIPDLLTGAPDSYIPANNGDVILRQLDDLLLQANPSLVGPGAKLSFDTRGGPAGGLAGLYAVDFSGLPLNFFLAIGTFDALGIFSIGGTAPPGLKGNTFTARSYAVGFNGKVIDSQDVTITFQ